MKLVVNKNLVNNNYEVLLEIVDIQQTDKDLLADFGEPVINIGGAVIEEVTKDDGMGGTIVETVTVAELGNTYRKFPSEFPLKRVFTQAEFGANAEKIANLYADKIENGLKTVLADLRTKQDTFSKVEEILL